MTTRLIKNTEILTSDGWKSVAHIDTSDSILTLHKDTFEMNYRTLAICKESPLFSADLINFESLNMDITLPSDSLILNTIRSDDGTYRNFISPASSIHKSYKLPLTGFRWETVQAPEYFVLPSVEQLEQYTRRPIIMSEVHIPMKEWLTFLGFFLADGSVSHGFNTQGSRKYLVSIKQDVCRENEVFSMFRGIGFEPFKHDGGSPRSYNYTVYSKQLWSYLRQFGFSSERYIPREFLNLPQPLLLSLWKGYVFGNSSKSKEGQTQLSTNSHQLADDLQELILKTFGRIVQVRRQEKRLSYREGYVTMYVINVTFGKSRDNYTGFRKSRKFEYFGDLFDISFDEPDFCILIRQNGIIQWVGA
ncbi:MAG: hypothetical protein IK042_05040 [Bacteroidales bacterium]|nr:hypothetical protein [Bacteroidales bacterium]